MSETYTVYSTQIYMWRGKMDEDSYLDMKPTEFDDYVRPWIEEDFKKSLKYDDVEKVIILSPERIKLKVHVDKSSNVWIDTMVIVQVVRLANATIREVNVFKLKNPEFDGVVEMEL